MNGGQTGRIAMSRIAYESLGSKKVRYTCLFIADVPTKGGATESMIRLILELRERYNVRSIVCTAQHSDLNKRLDSLGIENHVTLHSQFLIAPPALAVKRPFTLLKAFIAYRQSFTESIKKAEETIDFSQVDIIHSNLPRTDLGEELARRHQLPHICHLREFSFEDFHCVSFRRKPGKYLSDHSTQLVAVSQAVKAAWERRGVAKGKIQVVYNGVETAQYAHAAALTERQSPSDTGAIKCVFLGGCSEAKGVWDAVKAVEHFDSSKKISLDIYGGDSRTTITKVRTYIRLRGLKDRISVLDRVSDIADKLGKYNIALVCSRSEGFGRVVIEYQAAGVPVIAANTGGLPELIRDGENGLLYDKKVGWISLKKRILSLSESPSLWTIIRKGGLESAQEFTASKNADEIFKIYQHVMGMGN